MMMMMMMTTIPAIRFFFGCLRGSKISMTCCQLATPRTGPDLEKYYTPENSYCWWFRNPANQLRLVVEIPLFTGFYTSQVVVWDVFHQQYCYSPLGKVIARNPFRMKNDSWANPKTVFLLDDSEGVYGACHRKLLAFQPRIFQVDPVMAGSARGSRFSSWDSRESLNKKSFVHHPGVVTSQLSHPHGG